LPRPITTWFVKSSGLKSCRTPAKSLVLGLSASSESMLEAVASDIGLASQQSLWRITTALRVTQPCLWPQTGATPGTLPLAGRISSLNLFALSYLGLFACVQMPCSLRPAPVKLSSDPAGLRIVTESKEKWSKQPT